MRNYHQINFGFFDHFIVIIQLRMKRGGVEASRNGCELVKGDGVVAMTCNLHYWSITEKTLN